MLPSPYALFDHSISINEKGNWRTRWETISDRPAYKWVDPKGLPGVSGCA